MCADSDEPSKLLTACLVLIRSALLETLLIRISVLVCLIARLYGACSMCAKSDECSKFVGRLSGEDVVSSLSLSHSLALSICMEEGNILFVVLVRCAQTPTNPQILLKACSVKLRLTF